MTDWTNNSSDRGEDADLRLAELVDELTLKLQRGEPLSLESYTQAHPEFASELRELFPTLTLMKGLRSAAEGRDGDNDDSNRRKSSAPSQPQLPKALGDFRIVGEIARGSMGVVYEAEQLSLGRPVALKVLPFAALLDERHRQRFQNEARAAATLEHPNIVTVYGVGQERGVHFYAMKLIRGQSLAELLKALRQKGDMPGAAGNLDGSLSKTAASLLTGHAPAKAEGDKLLETTPAWGLGAARK